MSNNLPTTALPGWQRDRLALLLDALDDVLITDAERASLTWLSGWELRTAQNIAAVITPRVDTDPGGWGRADHCRAGPGQVGLTGSSAGG